jgi:hypothetical protein
VGWLRAHWIAVAVGVVVFFIGVGIGGAGSGSGDGEAAEAEAVTVTEDAETETVTETETETKTETETVEAEPPAVEPPPGPSSAFGAGTYFVGERDQAWDVQGTRRRRLLLGTPLGPLRRARRHHRERRFRAERNRHDCALGQSVRVERLRGVDGRRLDDSWLAHDSGAPSVSLTLGFLRPAKRSGAPPY